MMRPPARVVRTETEGRVFMNEDDMRDRRLDELDLNILYGIADYSTES
jgi:hypothetical protein